VATIAMRRIRHGEVPKDGGTALQEDAGRPVFHGNGPNDYVCAECGNVLAEAMDPAYMTKKVRVRCGRCSTVNVAVSDESVDPRRRRADPAAGA
jgi:phage FluMu protein Com